MDGLPKNKRPLPKKDERPQIALDDYLFERKLQEVYDKKEMSDDMPVLLQKLATLGSRVRKRRAAKTAPPKKKKKTEAFIDSPQHMKPRFNKVVRKQKSEQQFKGDVPNSPKRKKLAVFMYMGAHKRVTYIAMGATVIVVASVVTVATLSGKKQRENKGEVAGASTEVARPTFEPLASSNQVKQKIKFDTTREVASYEDKIGGVRMVVSQQKLAEKDRVDPNFLSRTATAFNLKTEMTTKKGQAFTGVNIEKNTQFTMFVYKDFLVFIQGDESVKNQLIVEYIDSLE